jgi:hypothetical protein
MKYLPLLTIFIFFIINKMNATHGLPLVNLTYTLGSSGITISAESDPATCGSGPYWMQAQFSTVSNMQSTPPAALQTTLANGANGASTYSLFPWYNSILNIPTMNAANGWSDACVPGEKYYDIFVPYTDLTCGGVYYFSVREWIGGSNSPGPWSSVFSFTVPSLPLNNLTFNLDTSNDTICMYDSTFLFPININNGPISNASWSFSSVNSTSLAVSPTVTTTYTLVANNSSYCSYLDTITIFVKPYLSPSFTPSNPIICSSNNIIFNAVGSSSLASHQWNVSPNNGFVVNNSTITPTPDITFNNAANYVVTHTIYAYGCSYVNSTNVLVNSCTSVYEYDKNNFKVWPNPSSDGVFYIKNSNENMKETTLNIIDIYGKSILQNKITDTNSLEIKLNSGIYFIIFEDYEHKKSVEKIIID